MKALITEVNMCEILWHVAAASSALFANRINCGSRNRSRTTAEQGHGQTVRHSGCVLGCNEVLNDRSIWPRNHDSSEFWHDHDQTTMTLRRTNRFGK